MNINDIRLSISCNPSIEYQQNIFLTIFFRACVFFELVFMWIKMEQRKSTLID